MKTIISFAVVAILSAGAAVAGEDGGPDRDGSRVGNGPLFGGCAAPCIATYAPDGQGGYKLVSKTPK